MNYLKVTVFYFARWCAICGCALGGWFGTFVMPVFATVVGAVWGIGIGFVTGLVCGVLVYVIQRSTLHPDVDLDRYRRRLSVVMGLVGGLLTLGLLILSGSDLLWTQTYFTDPIKVFLTAIVVVGQGLAVAYVAHGYPRQLSIWILQEEEPFEALGIGERLARKMGDQVDAGAGWLEFFVAACSGVLAWLMAYRDWEHLPSLAAIPGEFAVGLTLSMILIIPSIVGVLMCGVSIFLVYLKRLLFFSEIETSASYTEQLTLALSGGVFTGVNLLLLFMIHHFAITPPLIITIGAFMIGMHIVVYRTLAPEKKAKSAQSM